VSPTDDLPQDRETFLKRGAVAIVLGALFLSGVASIVNQVVWQRALKIFLGGSETISAMVVVLVFMLGLGLGAAWMGKYAHRLSNPLRTFAVLEGLLFLTNIGLAFLLAQDLSESVYAAQRIALSAGIPLRAVYAACAAIILLPPTALMGATLPAASEACQRQLGATESSLITVLFFLNTVGAVVGAFGGSFLLLPYFGQKISLLSAAGFNLAAAAVLLALAIRIGLPGSSREPNPGESTRGWRPRPEEWLGLGLGFFSLGYEIYLFRLISLTYKPLPFSFATTLCFYLLLWSIGVYFSSRMAKQMHWSFLAAAISVAITPFIYEYDRWEAHFSLFPGGLIYFLPCLFFGALYGALVSTSARSWGSDVGRFYAYNTVGSCLGIMSFTLAGYELPLHYGAWLIAAGLVWLLLHWIKNTGKYEAPGQWALRGAAMAVLIGMVLTGYWAATIAYSESEESKIRSYWGRDGVAEVFPNGDVYLDGLWHSRLSQGGHIGRPYTWMMAVAAVLSHGGKPVHDILVIGNGVGMTASTLALLPRVEVDTYEVNQTLKHVLEDYEKLTLAVARNPKINIFWTDARSGMALNPKRYDIIVSAPLYLRQAGSSILLSKEYFELLKSRLKPGGVVAVYSHEGPPQQSMLVRRTVGNVFKHLQTFDDHVILTASDSPIDITAEKFRQLLQRTDPFYRQLKQFERRRRKQKEKGIWARIDRPSAPVEPGRYLITDDHPLVEYPDAAARLVDMR